MSHADALDHVGIAGSDLGAMAAAYERLGFLLTPRARHSGRRTPDGPIIPFGTGNRCIMLRQGYIELIAIVDPAAFNNMLDDFVARHPGIHIIALGMEDEEANLARLRRAGIDLPGVAYLERPVDDAAPDGSRVRFARLPLPDAPEGRLQLIRHLTREAMWQERFLDHPNHAVALEEVVIAVEHPADSAARFSRLAGLPVVPDPAGGYALPMPQGRVRLLPPDAVGTALPGVAVLALPFVAGMQVRTDDGNAAAKALLEQNGVAHQQSGSDVVVGASEAAGVTIRFAG